MSTRLSLHRAIQRYDVAEVRKLLRIRGESQVNIEAKNGGETPLLHAIRLYIVLAARSVSMDPDMEPDDFLQEIEEFNTQNERNNVVRRWRAERMLIINNMRKVLEIIVMLIGAGADVDTIREMMRRSRFSVWDADSGVNRYSNETVWGLKNFYLNDHPFVRKELDNAIKIAMKIRDQQRRSARQSLNRHLPNNLVQMILKKAKLTNRGPNSGGMVNEMISNRRALGQSDKPRVTLKRPRSSKGTNANPRPGKRPKK